MKLKRLTAMVLVLVMACTVALAEIGEYSYDGSTFKGMIYNGKPNGMGELAFDSGTVSYVMMTDGTRDGVSVTCYDRCTSDSHENLAMYLSFYKDGKQEGACYTVMRSNSLVYALYSAGTLTRKIVGDANGNLTEYEVVNGEATDKRTLLTEADVAGTLLAEGPFEYVAETDEQDTIYTLRTKADGTHVFSVTFRGNMGIIDTGALGQLIAFSLDNDYYIKGESGQSISDMVRVYADGTVEEID